MNANGLTHGQIVAGFGGENRTSPDLLLPPTVSPDAMNIEYTDSTIKKRGGIERLIGYLVGAQSVVIPSSSLNGASIPAYDYGAVLGSSWTVEVAAYAMWTGTLPLGYYMVYSTTDIDTTIWIGIKSDGSGNDTWCAKVLGTAGANTETIELIGPTPQSYPRAFISLHLSHKTLTFNVNGFIDTASFSTGYAISWPATTGMQCGGGNGNWVHYAVDELRIHSGTPATTIFSNTAYLANASSITNCYGYFPMSNSILTLSCSDLSQVGATMTYAGEVIPCIGFHSTSHVPHWYEITALSSVSNTGMFIHTPFNLYHYLFSSDVLTAHKAIDAYPTYRRSSSCSIRGKTIIVDGSMTNSKYYTSLQDLTPPKPVASATTLTAGAAGNPNGAYYYAFQFKNSVDGTVGPRSTDSLTITVTSDKVAIASIPTTSDTQVDTVIIYRTLAGGAVFYYLDEIAEGTTTYTDDIADSGLVTPYDQYVGIPDKAKIAITHDARLWLMNTASNSRRALYSEISDDTLPGGFASFPATNYVDYEEDPEEITGATSVSGMLLVFKRNSIWATTGSGSYGTYRLHNGIGCVSHDTIHESDRGVYFLGANGVYLIPKPIGTSAPIDITKDTHREVFAGITESDTPLPCAAYDPINKLYIIALRSDGEDMTLVYSENNGTWAKWDCDITALRYMADESGVGRVYCGFRGHVCHLQGRNNNDGIDLQDVDDIRVSGTIAESGNLYLTDNDAMFPAARDYNLIGCTVSVETAAGETYTRKIIYNTSNTLYVTHENEVGGQWTISADDTYYIGGYSSYWTSPSLIFESEPGKEDTIHWLRVWFRNPGNNDVVDIDYV